MPLQDTANVADAALARFKGSSREHTKSDLRCFFAWSPSTAWTRWPPGVRIWSSTSGGCKRSAFKPSTVSRRFSVTAGFYSTAVIDGLLEHSPAEHVRRPSVLPNHPPSGSPTCNSRPCSPPPASPATPATSRSWPCWPPRSPWASGADIADLGEEHGHRVLRVCGKGTRIILVPLPPAVGRAIDQATGARTRGPILLNTRGARMDRHAATRRLRRLAELPHTDHQGAPAYAPAHICNDHARCWGGPARCPGWGRAGVDRDVRIAARHADPRTTMRYDRARKNPDRHPNYILAAYMASGT